MADEQVSVFTASRPDSEGSHTQKEHGSAKLKSDRNFSYEPFVPYPKATEVRKNLLTSNPSLPPLIVRGGDKGNIKTPLHLNLAFASKQSGHGVASLTERRRAGIGIYCESARKRSEPYPKATAVRKRSSCLEG